MKKKLLVTTAALSLSLTSLAPVTSLAATQSTTGVNNEPSHPETMVPASVVDRAAERLGGIHADKFTSQIIEKLNNSSNKLGYLKGDKLTIKLDNDGKISGVDMLAPPEDQVKFTGKSALEYSTIIQGDPTLEVIHDKSTNEIGEWGWLFFSDMGVVFNLGSGK